MKKNILLIIISGLFFSSISVFATLTYSANQITYTKGNNTMYLSEAIDELYTTQGTTVTNLNNQVTSLQSQVNSYSTFSIYFQVFASYFQLLIYLVDFVL